MTFLLWLARLVLPVLLVAGLLADRSFDTSGGPTENAALVETQVRVPSKQSLTSTWYCPTAHSRKVADSGVDATAELLVTNTTAEPTRASVYLLSPTSPRQLVHVQVPGLSTRSLKVANHTDDELVSALVEAPTSGVVVSRHLRSGLGSDIATCSSIVANEWYIISADTQADAIDRLVIYNPLPTDAVVDLRFATEAEVGAYVSPELVGLVVPAASAISVGIGEHVRRRDIVATTVQARLGRVVVDHLQTFDGSSGRLGFSAHLATAANSTLWYHPVIQLEEGRRVSVAVANPTEVVAAVDVTVVTGEGKKESIAISVGPYDVTRVDVVSNSEETASTGTLFTTPGFFGIIVESSGAVPVVSGIEVASGPDGSPGRESPEDDLLSVDDEGRRSDPPAGRVSGLSITSGLPNGSNRWLLTVPELAGEVTVGIQNGAAATATVTIFRYGQRNRYELRMGAHASRQIRVAAGTTIEIKADAPIAVAAVRQERNGAGLNSVLGVKFSEENR
ncbi:MAG: DUF5719 family protein [Acidimicrobiales bacterium]|nr:DUF5719 family protein [Acidimicrobiales bacterium]